MKITIKLVALILLLTMSLWSLLSPALFKAEGVKVVSIDENADCGNLKVGDIISQIEGNFVNSEQEFNAILKFMEKGRTVTLVVNGGPGRCTVLSDGELGVEVSDVSSKGFRFGTDLVGGEKVLLSSDDELSYADATYVSNALEKRLKIAGLHDSKVSLDGSIISISAPAGAQFYQVLINGSLEGLIEQEVKLTNGTGKIRIGNESYEFFWSKSKNESNLMVEGQWHAVGAFFSLGGMQLKVVNATNESALVDVLIFDNSEIGKAAGSVSYVNYDTNSRQYQFNIPIEVLGSASERFSKVTEGLLPLYGTELGLLNGVLIYRLDDEEISKLSIPSSMAGTPIRAISIIGGGNNMEEAVNKKTLVEIALEGKFGKKIFIKSVESFPGELSWTILLGEFVLGIGILSVFLIGLIRYKNLKIGVVGASVLIVEIVYILGVISISQSLAPGWVLDFSSLFGLCIFLILSMVQIILLSEKALRARILKRYNYFVYFVFVFGFLMLFTPLSRMGLALIVGWLISTALTKPAYTDFLSKSG